MEFQNIVDFLTKHDKIVATIGGIFAIMGGLYFAGGQVRYWVKWALTKLAAWVNARFPFIPSETIRLVPIPRRCRWGEGKLNGLPAMQLNAELVATNIIDKNVILLRAYILKPFCEGVVLTRHTSANEFGQYAVFPGKSTEVALSFWLQSLSCKIGQDFVGTIKVIDQFNNCYKLKDLHFQGPTTPQLLKPTPPKEAIYSITDPLEKSIVSILKAESDRYKACGRSTGGLGSLQTVLNGRTYTGVGANADWRDADSPKNQSIVPSPEQASITSDNVSAMLGLFERLKTTVEKDHFRDYLLHRLHSQSEYASIAYFIVYVLYCTKQIEIALITAKKRLDDENYSISNVTMLIDGLLRHNHHKFEEKDLDTVERFVEGLQTHPFKILERVAAIRSYRLAKVSTRLS